MTRGTKKKQDVIISDQSGTAIVQLWEENLDSLKGESCILKAFRIAEYDNMKYLAMSRETSEVLPTDDIVDAVQLSPTQAITDNTFVNIKNPRIAAVYKLESFKMCIRCRSRVEPGMAPLGRCTRYECAVLQDYTLCDTSSVAELLVMDGFKKLCLYAFGARMAEVAATENATEQQMLTAPPISEIIYDEQNSEIVKVVRP